MNNPTQATAPALAQHTPAPWKVSHNGRDDCRIFAESVADSPRAICKVNEPLGRMLEAHANARLIAAAPDLLAALILCERALTPSRNDRDLIAADEARQAIARATGTP